MVYIQYTDSYIWEYYQPTKIGNNAQKQKKA